jgi:hypothetical protein
MRRISYRGIALGLLVVGAILTGSVLIATEEPCLHMEPVTCSNTNAACSTAGNLDYGAMACTGDVGCCDGSGGGRSFPSI